MTRLAFVLSALACAVCALAIWGCNGRTQQWNYSTMRPQEPSLSIAPGQP